jgi:DNA-binding transcriptional LysR family regulator
MDLTRMRTFQELAIRKTMAAVAEALRLSPSAVSQQIAQLEVEAGVPLIERRGRGVRLTAAGEVLRAHADRLVVILEEARTDLAELKNEIGGEVHLASFPSIGAALLPFVIREVQKKHPRVQITLHEHEPDEGLAALRAWEADAAIIDDMATSIDLAGSAVETMPLLRDKLFAMIPRDHPLARAKQVSFEDLKDEWWALDSSRAVYSQSLQRFCEKVGFTPKINARCNSFEVMASMVETGCSISVVPGMRLRSQRGTFVLKPLAPEIPRFISAVWRRGERRNPALDVVLSELKLQAKSFYADELQDK